MGLGLGSYFFLPYLFFLGFSWTIFSLDYFFLGFFLFLAFWLFLDSFWFFGFVWFYFVWLCFSPPFSVPLGFFFL
ncbi:hypothetical protein BZA77DRAFT_308208 [Pyronema omphalodes]|nr:hypothetical protein BZA77DRAFT_308208 [Pyronema omphalodes]